MSRCLVILLSILVSAPAFAAGSLTQFRCKTTQPFMSDTVHRFSFKVKNLRSGKITYGDFDPESASGDEKVVRVTPSDSSIDFLNDNWVIKRIPEGVQMFGDGDGCLTVNLRLYKDQAYEEGWVRVTDHGCGNGNGYGVVTCTVKEIE